MSIFKKDGMHVVTVALGAMCAPNVYGMDFVSPEQGEVLYGSPLHIVVKLHNTPGYDVSLKFEWMPLHIPGQFPGSGYKEETVQVLNTNENPSGTTALTVLIPKGGDWRMLASEHPQQSSTPVNATGYRNFTVLDPGQKTVYTEINSGPFEYFGPCPTQIKFHGLIGSASKNGQGSYRFIRSWDSQGTPVQQWVLEKPGVIPVSVDFPSDVAPPSGWVAIEVQGPGGPYISNHGTFSVTCAIMDIKLFIPWKSLPQLPPPPQSCKECVSTYKQIVGIDLESMPRVQEGEGLVAGAGKDRAKAQRLNQLKSQLDSNMTRRRALVSEYNSQISKFQMMQRPPANSGEPQGVIPRSELPARRGL